MFYFSVLAILIVILNFVRIVDMSLPYIAIFLHYFVLIFIPGHYLAKQFCEKKNFDSFEMIPLSICCGYGFFTLPVLVAFLFSLSLKIFIIFYLFLILIYIALSKYYMDKKNEYFVAKSNIAFSTSFVLIVLLVISFMMADYYGGFTSGNFLMHVSSIRKLYSSGVFYQSNCYFEGIKYSLNMYSTYYALLSIISYNTNIDPVKIWIYLPQFILPIGILSQFVFLRFMFKEEKPAIYATIIYYIYYCVYEFNMTADGHAWWHSELSACNNYIASGIFLPIIFLLVFKYLENKNNKFLFLISLVLTAQSFVHLYIQSKTYFLLFGVLFWMILTKHKFADYKSVLKVGGVALFGIIFFVYTFLTMNINVNPAYLTPGGTGGGFPFVNFGKWIIADPYVGLLSDPYTILGTLIFILSVFYVRSNLASLFVFSGFFCVFFVIYNPFLMELGIHYNPANERITRLYNVIPFYISLSLPFYSKAFVNNIFLKKIMVLAVIVSSGYLLYKSPQRLENIVYNKKESLRQFTNNKSFYDMVNRYIPSGSVVMINLPMTTWWTTYFPHYIVAHAFNMILPPNIDQTSRQKDVEYFYKNRIDSKSFEILEKYNVGYVLFFGEELISKNIEMHKEFIPVFSNRQFNIYKYKKRNKL